ncbi:Opacity protein [Geoalkalibacter ferrihydriticus]|uniref:Opacity protein n=1 Tax=Geoalkalibacter ferrihydriticus TaxID=392333 RepID=A0A1G9TQ49_9BACT|nr:outer membrane beta-barrel protein [Geoalkalibacter ferrihydriticus]SDM49235.1 Opacity protein [Geoalkalibacter ferrihydriticus]
MQTRTFLRYFLFLIFALFFALPLHAADGFYVGAWGGGTLLDEARVRGHQGSFNADFDGGMAFGAALGYDFAERYPQIGKGRMELEWSYRANDLKDARFTDGRFAAEGDVSVWSLMVNSFAEYHVTRPWLPYVGLGAGYARLSLNNARLAGTPLGDDSDDVFAYQFGGGLGYQVNNHLTVDLGYRYFATLDATLRLADQTSVDWEYDSHTLLLGLRLTFR